MTKYEELVIEAEKHGVSVIEIDLGTKKKCGKYLSKDTENIVVVNSSINEVEKYEVLAEELGHHYTSFGNIIDQKNISNIKQEKLARNFCYEKLVGIVDIINAFNQGARNSFDMSELLGVTEEFLKEAIKHYKSKYGICVQIDNYVIYFEPNLGVLKLF